MVIVIGSNSFRPAFFARVSDVYHHTYNNKNNAEYSSFYQSI